MKKKHIILGVGVAVLLAVLFAWPKMFNEERKEALARLDLAEVGCLPNGHTNLGQHIHPFLRVDLDGKPITMPADIGVIDSCMGEMHTHDSTGKIHLETASPTKTFTLQQFMTLWGQPLQREGFALEMTVDGQPSPDYGSLILKDKQEVVLKYTKTQ